MQPMHRINLHKSIGFTYFSQWLRPCLIAMQGHTQCSIEWPRLNPYPNIDLGPWIKPGPRTISYKPSSTQPRKLILGKLWYCFKNKLTEISGFDTARVILVYLYFSPGNTFSRKYRSTWTLSKRTLQRGKTRWSTWNNKPFLKFAFMQSNLTSI